MTKRLVVYGTLRRGGNFAKAKPDKGYCEIHELHGVKVYMTTSFFPGAAISDDEKDYVVAEIWDFEGYLSDDEWERLVWRLDGIECIGRDNNGLFRRTTVDTPLGEACIYLMNAKDLVESTIKKNQVVRDWTEIDPRIGKNVDYVRKAFGRRDGRRVKTEKKSAAGER